MKRTIAVLLALCLAAALALPGCSKSAAGAGQAETPSAAQSQAAAGGQVSASAGDVQVAAGENMPWPGSDLGGLPAPAAKVTAVLRDGTTKGVIVALAELSKENAAAYTAKLKELGYQAAMESADAQTSLFIGTNAAGDSVTFSYDLTTGEGGVTWAPAAAGQGTSPAEAPESSGPADMTDVSPWPRDFLPGVPELAGKITNVINSNNENVTVELEQVEKADFEAFVAALKQGGYTQDADEVTDAYNSEYTARSAAGDYVSAALRYEYKTVSVYMEKAAG